LVARHFDDFQGASRFIIRPNCSLSWRGVVRFYMSMVVVSFGIALVFAIQGAWLILPFAGLEMLVLGAALYVVARRAYRWQSVSIHADRVVITEHDQSSERQQTFQRAWAQVRLEPARIKGYPPRLFIRSHGRAVEIGGYLADAEKEHLALELRRAMWPSGASASAAVSAP
jgi:uncharacterized membrane protein